MEGRPPPSEPMRIGGYRLHEILGEGGMGTVYRAVQTEPVRREVALKVIKLGMDTKEVVARFQSERQALAVMSHTSIAKVLLGGEAAEAEALAGDVVRIQREIELADAALVGSALRTWGRALTELGRFAEAEEALLEGHGIESDGLGAEGPATRRTGEALVPLYDSWGRDDEAAAWRERLRR